MPSRNEVSDDEAEYEEWVRDLASDARGCSPETVADSAVVATDRVGDDVGVFLGSEHREDGSVTHGRRWPKDVLMSRATDYPYPESYPTELRALAVRVLSRDIDAELRQRRRQPSD